MHLTLILYLKNLQVKMPKEIETKKTKIRGLIEKPKRYQTSDSDDNPFIKKRKNKVQNIL